MISLPTSRCSRSRSLIISLAMFGSPPVRCARRLGAQRRVPADLLHRVELRELLPDRALVVAAELLRQLDQPCAAADAAAAGAAGADLADVVADAIVELARHRTGERVARAARPAGTEPGALGHQRRVRRRPTVVEPADDVVVVHDARCR